ARDCVRAVLSVVSFGAPHDAQRGGMLNVFACRTTSQPCSADPGGGATPGEDAPPGGGAGCAGMIGRGSTAAPAGANGAGPAGRESRCAGSGAPPGIALKSWI